MLQISGADIVVEADTFLEAGALPVPLPPFDVPLGPTLRWEDVPVRGPHWLMLRPLGTEEEQRHLYATLLRMPRIHTLGPLEEGPWISVEPIDNPRRTHIIEPIKKPAADTQGETIPLSPAETFVLVDAHGRNARRVVISCDIDEKLGNRLTMFLDGRKATSRRITISTMRLEARATAGVHRVRIEGAQNGRCTIAARAAQGVVTVRRRVYLLSTKNGLTVKVRSEKRGARRLHYAIYAEAAHVQKGHGAALFLTVDGGRPRRRIGPSTSMTSGQTHEVLRFEPVDFPGVGPRKGIAMRQLALGSMQLGDDLRASYHLVHLRLSSPGRFWARFWISGRPGPHESVESWITTDAAEQSELEE